MCDCGPAAWEKPVAQANSGEQSEFGKTVPCAHFSTFPGQSEIIYAVGTKAFLAIMRISTASRPSCATGHSLAVFKAWS